MCDLNDINYKNKLIKVLEKCRKYINQKPAKLEVEMSVESVAKFRKIINDDQNIKLVRKIRREFLSKPYSRRLKPWPNPKLEGPHKISRAALNAKMSKRLEYLAIPRKDNFCEHEYNTQNRPVTSVTRRNKKIISSRLIELSRPKLSIYNMDDEIEPMRFKSNKEWKAHLDRLTVFAAARRPPPSPLGPKRIKIPLSKILPRIQELSVPVNRPPNLNERTYEELYKIKSATLRYIASDRIQRLASVKPLNEETILNLNYDPNTKILNAIKYKATARIIELAKPRIRTSREMSEITFDAYKVSERALKARCSARIKELAKPINRDFD